MVVTALPSLVRGDFLLLSKDPFKIDTGGTSVELDFLFPL